MNLFFNPIKDLQNYANQFSGQNNGGKQQKLKTQLYHCTYNDQIKYVIEKSVKQVLHVYPFFETQILTFTENNQQRRYLELKGILEIEIRGKMCKVDYNMMLPNGFPKKSPYIRIINRNSEYNVDSFYHDCKSPTDAKSFILNSKLNQCKNWDASKSLVNVVIQSQDLLRNHFPFTKHKSVMNSQTNSTSSGGGNWGSNSPWQNPNFNNNTNNNSSWGNNKSNTGWVNNWGSNNNNTNSNPGFVNNNQSSWGNNQGWNNNNNNSNQSSWGNNNNNSSWGNNNNSNQNSWGNNNNSSGWGTNKQPPIPFGNQNNVNISDAIAKSQKFVGQNKKTLEKLRTQHIKALQTIQHLQVLKESLESQENYLRKQNHEMTIFLQQSQNNSDEKLSSVVQPSDSLSSQILDVYSNIKARQEAVSFLQTKFNDGVISFDQFLKHVRKIQEQKFDDKALLNKCMTIMKQRA